MRSSGGGEEGSSGGGGGLPTSLRGLRETLVSGAWLPESEAYEAAVRAAGCEWVRRTATVTKRLVVACLPPVLCLQLRRTDWATHGLVKIHGHVSFPMRLELDERLAPRLGSQLAPPGRAAAGTAGCSPSAGCSQPAAAAVAAAVPPAQAGKDDYNLRAVIVHHGIASSGHYTVFRCLDEAGGRWASASDETVAPATAEEVLAAEATLLLYERRQPAAQMAPDA